MVRDNLQYCRKLASTVAGPLQITLRFDHSIYGSIIRKKGEGHSVVISLLIGVQLLSRIVPELKKISLLHPTYQLDLGLSISSFVYLAKNILTLWLPGSWTLCGKPHTAWLSPVCYPPPLPPVGSRVISNGAGKLHGSFSDQKVGSEFRSRRCKSCTILRTKVLRKQALICFFLAQSDRGS